MARKTMFPRLRKKGHRLYFDTQELPRRWIPLGRADDPKAMAEYHRLAKSTAEAEPQTVMRMLREYIDHLAKGGIGPRGRPITASSLHAYRAFAANVEAWAGPKKRPAEIKQSHVSQYLRKCTRTSSRGEISVLSGAYQHAMGKGDVDFDPCIGVKAWRAASRRDRLLSDAEFVRIRQHARPMLRVAMDLAYVFGLRPIDLVRLRWDSFGDDSIVEHQKTKFRQRLPLGPDVQAILDDARALRSEVRGMTVLADRGGKPLSTHKLRDWWGEACDAAAIEDAQFRDIRAKAGTDREAGGATVADVSSFLGHTNTRTTEIYLRGKRVKTVIPNRRKTG